MQVKNKLLFVGGILCFSISILHIIIIFGGADWYRFFGAGEGMAQLSEQGDNYPIVITGFIAIILFLWGLYGISGAGIIPKLPLLKLGLGLVAGIFLVRGVFGIPATIFIDHPYLNELQNKMTFMIISSIISVSFGLLYAIGLSQIWKQK